MDGTLNLKLSSGCKGDVVRNSVLTIQKTKV